jgi:hypothetical protein
VRWATTVFATYLVRSQTLSALVANGLSDKIDYFAGSVTENLAPLLCSILVKPHFPPIWVVYGRLVLVSVVQQRGDTNYDYARLTGHTVSFGVPRVEKIDLMRANSLPNSPASKRGAWSGRIISATTHPAAHISSEVS